MARIAPIAVAFATLFMLGCASQPITHRDPQDPFERINRVTFKVNDALDRAVAKPVAKTYVKVVPKFIRTGVSNVLSNAAYPTVIVNEILQAKFLPALRDTGRLLLNTTVGLGGLLDPASAAGLPRDDEDFGQTLGWWGVPPGPFIELPLLGASDVRDAIGLIPDEYTNGRHYIDDNAWFWGVAVLHLVDLRASLLKTEATLLQGVYDRYSFIRDAYLQRRKYLVHDGEVGGESLEQMLQESGAGDDSQSPSPPEAQPNPQSAPAQPSAQPSAPTQPPAPPGKP